MTETTTNRHITESGKEKSLGCSDGASLGQLLLRQSKRTILHHSATWQFMAIFSTVFRNKDVFSTVRNSMEQLSIKP